MAIIPNKNIMKLIYPVNNYVRAFPLPPVASNEGVTPMWPSNVGV